MRRLLAALGAAGLAADSGPAASPTPPAPAPLSAAAAPLVARLGADSFADREAAARGLLRLGEVALPALDRVAASRTDPEARERAARLADQIRRAADGARMLTVAPVALNYVGVPVAKAIEDLKARTGVPLTPHIPGLADPSRLVTVKTDPLPPWQAVEEFCLAAGLREVHRTDALPPAANQVEAVGRRRIAYSMAEIPQMLPGTVPIVLADGKPDATPGDRSGAVRVVALPAAFPGNRVVRGAGEVVLNLDVTPLPGVRWTDAVAVRVHRAEDETGRPITVSHRPDAPAGANGMNGEVQVFGGFAGQVWINDDFGNPRPATRPNPRVVPVKLRTDDRAVTRLKVFEGVVVGEVSVPNQTLVSVPDLAKPSGVAVPGPNDTKFSVLGYEARPDGRVVVRVRTDGPNPWTMQRLGLANRALQLNAGGDGIGVVGGVGQLRFFDADGKPVRTPSVASSNMSDDGFRQTQELELVFNKYPDNGPPVRVDLVGSKAITVDVPFRMENVRLP